VCGDGRIQSSHDMKTVEECDDSNGEGGDGCSAECKVEPGYMCAIDAEIGYSKCREVVCGDGVRMNSHDGSKTEICDDGEEKKNPSQFKPQIKRRANSYSKPNRFLDSTPHPK
jgi:cysteine-rich repeat protein